MTTVILTALATLKQGAATLLLPFESNMKAFDSVLVFSLDSKPCFLFLQATIAARHPTSPQATDYLNSMIGAVPEGAVGALVFVLPNYRYESWQVQDIADKCVKSIMQFALCPGMEDQAAKTTGKRPGKSADEEEPETSKRPKM